MQWSVLVTGNDTTLDPMVADMLAKQERCDVVVASSLSRARALMAERDFDLVILRSELLDSRGEEFCSTLRQGGFKGAVILLSASDDENDVVNALDAGADDYVVTPLSSTALLARVRAQLRRMQPRRFMRNQVQYRSLVTALAHLLHRHRGDSLAGVT